MSILESPRATQPIYQRLSDQRKGALVNELQALLGITHVLHTPYDIALYEYDASIDHAQPDIVVFPADSQDVAKIVNLANRYQVPVVPRGAGTGLSGGARFWQYHSAYLWTARA